PAWRSASAGGPYRGSPATLPAARQPPAASTDPDRTPRPATRRPRPAPESLPQFQPRRSDVPASAGGCVWRAGGVAGAPNNDANGAANRLPPAAPPGRAAT